MPRSNERFNPTAHPYHANVVDNYRAAWRRQTDRDLSPISDETIFNIWRDSYADADSGAEHDTLVLELLSEQLDGLAAGNSLSS